MRPSLLTILLALALPASAAIRRPASLPLDLPASLPLAAGPSVAENLLLAAPASPQLPWYIRVADPEDAAWLARVVEASRASKTGREVLRKVEKAADKAGRPVIVEMRKVPYESFNWDWDVVTLKAQLKDGGIVEVPSILMHELLHFVQKEKGQLDTFELELEAYTVDLKVAQEVGHVPKRGTWEAKLHKKFAGDMDGFLGWLKGELYDDVSFASRMGLRAYRKDLDERLTASDRRRKRIERTLKRSRDVLSLMQESGQNQDAIDTYQRDVVERDERRLQDEANIRRWTARDRDAIESPAVWRRFKRYAKGVLSRLEKLHESRQD